MHMKGALFLTAAAAAGEEHHLDPTLFDRHFQAIRAFSA